jgi:hypothetical protein
LGCTGEWRKIKLFRSQYRFENLQKWTVEFGSTISREPYEGGKLEPMGNLRSFDATSTASHPGHVFVFGTLNKQPRILHRVYINDHDNTYVYDPYKVDGDPEATKEKLERELRPDQLALYQRWIDTIKFSEQYESFTGRPYIANYLRGRPKHFIWPADYFGQEHWVETKETHFVEAPPDELLAPIASLPTERRLREHDAPLLSQYRDPTQSTLNMTLKVLSCAPRVLEIKNFLSQTEIDHVLRLAAGVTLSRSTIGDIGMWH